MELSPSTHVQTGYLTPTGFFISAADASRGFGKRLETFLNKLTILYKGKVGKVKRTPLYCYNNGKLYLPRTMITMLITARVIKQLAITIAPVVRTPMPIVMPLFLDQVLIVEWLMMHIYTSRRIAAGTATCLFNLKAGSGKTFVAAGLIASIGMDALYVAPTIYLGEQAVTDICNVLGPGTAVMYSAAVRAQPAQAAARVIVIVINSAVTRPDAFYTRFGMVVLDEVHMYASDHNMKIFSRCTWCALGMSATTSNINKNRDNVLKLALAFDNVVHAGNIPGFAYREDTKFTCIANVIKYRGPPSHTQFLTHESTGMLFTHYMHEQFLEDHARTRMAVYELVKLYDWRGPSQQRHRIYVFAEEIKLLKAAKCSFERVLAWLGRDDIKLAIDDVDNSKLFTGGSTISDVNNVQVLFSTYGFAGQGVSIIDMTAILLLTPRRSNFLQIFARILRRGSDLTIPRVVIDIQDVATALRGQLSERLPAYEFYGFAIEYEKINYTDVIPMEFVHKFVNAFWYHYAIFMRFPAAIPIINALIDVGL